MINQKIPNSEGYDPRNSAERDSKDAEITDDGIKVEEHPSDAVEEVPTLEIGEQPDEIGGDPYNTADKFPKNNN